jgi:hypothetical protein
MTNKVEQVLSALEQSYLFEDTPQSRLATYHAAKLAINGNRRVGTLRRLAAIRQALKPFAVTVSANTYDLNGPIRLINHETKAEYIFTP